MAINGARSLASSGRVDNPANPAGQVDVAHGADRLDSMGPLNRTLHAVRTCATDAIRSVGTRLGVASVATANPRPIGHVNTHNPHSVAHVGVHNPRPIGRVAVRDDGIARGDVNADHPIPRADVRARPRHSLELHEAPEAHELSLEAAPEEDGDAGFDGYITVVSPDGRAKRRVAITKEQYAKFRKAERQYSRSDEFKDGFRRAAGRDREEDDLIALDPMNLKCTVTNRRRGEQHQIHVSDIDEGVEGFRTLSDEHKFAQTERWAKVNPNGIGMRNGVVQLDKYAAPLHNLGDVDAFKNNFLNDSVSKAGNAAERIAILTRIELFSRQRRFMLDRIQKRIDEHTRLKAGATPERVRHHDAAITHLTAIKNRLENETDQFAVCWALSHPTANLGEVAAKVDELQTALQGRLTPEPTKFQKVKIFVGYSQGPELTKEQEQQKIREYGLDAMRLNTRDRRENEAFSNHHNRALGNERFEHTLFAKTANDLMRGTAPTFNMDRNSGSIFAGMAAEDQRYFEAEMLTFTQQALEFANAAKGNPFGIVDGDNAAELRRKYESGRDVLLRPALTV